jgi:uncharacterized protein
VKVVLDTNTIVSAIGWARPPRAVLMALRDGRHSLVTSPGLLAELTNALRYPKLRPLAAHPLLPVVLEWLHRPKHLVVPQERLTVIRADPSDNLVLEAAVAAEAGAIVSGDQHVLALQSFRGIATLTALGFAHAHL